MKGKRGRRNQSSDDDDDDWEDDDDFVLESDDEGARKPAKKRAAGKGRGGGRKQADSDDDAFDDDSGGGGDDESDDDEAKLAGMNELERELYLFERDEKRARERERRAAMQAARQVEVRASSRRARGAAGVDTATAIGKLKAARQQRERRAARQTRDGDDGGGDDDDDAAERAERAAAAAAAAAGPGDDDADDDDADDERRFGARGARAYDEGDGSDSAGGEAGAGGDDEEDDDEGDEPADLEAVLKMQLTRDVLERWHAQPFFDDTVRGCVVRVLLGTVRDASGAEAPNYFMMRVVEAQERAPYRLQPNAPKTTKWLLLEENGATKALQMQIVSSKPVAPDEFARWQRHCERSGARRITRRDAAAAAARIAAAHGYRFTREDIQRKLAARREKGEAVGGVVAEIARVRDLLEAAESAGDADAAAQHRARLDELETAHVTVKRAAAGASLGMARINARNKTVNFEKALKNVGSRPGGDAGKEGGVDVFSRRQTQSKVYWQTRKKDDGDGAQAGDEQQQAQQQQQQQGQQQPAEPPAGGGDAAATRQLNRTLSAMAPAELLPLLKLDLDLDALPGSTGSGAAAAKLSTARRMLGGGRWQLSAAARELEAAVAANPMPVVRLSEWLAAARQQQQQQPS